MIAKMRVGLRTRSLRYILQANFPLCLRLLPFDRINLNKFERRSDVCAFYTPLFFVFLRKRIAMRFAARSFLPPSSFSVIVTFYCFLTFSLVFFFLFFFFFSLFFFFLLLVPFKHFIVWDKH